MKSQLIAALRVAVALLSCPALAQGMHGPPGGPGHRYLHLFNPKTLETVQGEIEGVERVSHRRTGAGVAVHVQLKTGEGERRVVHLGPAWFIDHQELQLVVGDRVTVTGSLVKWEGQPTLIATEVDRANEKLILRDADGVPVWDAWRRGKGS